jgi:hypothetical protein
VRIWDLFFLGCLKNLEKDFFKPTSTQGTGFFSPPWVDVF